MKKTLLALPLLLLIPTLPLHAGAQLENGDFSEKRAHWSGPGDVVALDASGNPQESEDGAAGHALEVKLRWNDWSIVEQKMRPFDDTKTIKITFEIQAMPDYVPAETSRAYSPEALDWKLNGWYIWSALVFPKAPLVVRLTDQSWHYAPRSVKNDGVWKAYQLEFDSLKLKDHTIAFTFPPGAGTIRIRNIVQLDN